MATFWPAEVLPSPSAKYGFDNEPAVRVTAMDSGRYRQREIYTTQYYFANVEFDLTDSQLEYFKGWYSVQLRNGEGKFSLSSAFGSGLYSNPASFEGDPSIKSSGPFEWKVSGRLLFESITEITSSGALTTAGGPLGLVGSDWVGVFPNPKINYSFDMESALMRTGMDVAAYYRRKRFETQVHFVNVTWFLSDAQMEFWLGWHKVILNHGVSPFDIDLAFGDGFKSNSAKILGGKFAAQYIAGQGNWEVSVTLEVEQVDQIDTYSEYLTEANAQGVSAMSMPIASADYTKTRFNVTQASRMNFALATYTAGS